MSSHIITEAVQNKIKELEAEFVACRSSIKSLSCVDDDDPAELAKILKFYELKRQLIDLKFEPDYHFDGWELLTPADIIKPEALKYLYDDKHLHDGMLHRFSHRDMITPLTDRQLMYLCSKLKLLPSRFCVQFEGCEDPDTYLDATKYKWYKNRGDEPLCKKEIRLTRSMLRHLLRANGDRESSSCSLLYGCFILRSTPHFSWQCETFHKRFQDIQIEKLKQLATTQQNFWVAQLGPCNERLSHVGNDRERLTQKIFLTEVGARSYISEHMEDHTRSGYSPVPFHSCKNKTLAEIMSGGPIVFHNPKLSYRSNFFNC